MVAVLVFVSGASYALYQNSLRPEPELATSAAVSHGLMTLNWRGERSGDVERVRRALPEVVVAVRVSDFRVAVPSCTALRPVRTLVGPTCEGTQVHPRASQTFKALTGMDLIVRPEDRPDDFDVVLLSQHPLSEVDVTRRLSGLPAINLSNGIQVHHGGVPGWILLCWLSAVVVLGVATARELGDRLLLARLENAGLWKLGLSSREIRLVEIYSLTPPIVAALGIGWAAALCFALVGYDLGVTAGTVTGMTVACLVTAAAALTAFAFLMRARLTHA